MEDRTKKRLIFAGGICGCLIIGAICLMIGLSFYVLSPLFYGLEFHKTTETLYSDKLYKSGRHFVGLGYTLKEFPRFQFGLQFSSDLKGNDDAIRRYSDNVKYYESVRVRTSESIKVHIAFAVQYRLTTASSDDDIAKQLHEIYNNFGFEWTPFLRVLSRAAVMDVCSEFGFQTFISDRKALGARLRQKLKEKYDFYHFTLEFATILNIDFPSSLQAEIGVTEITKQNILKATYEQDIRRIEADTDALVAKVTRRISIHDWETLGIRQTNYYASHTTNAELWANTYYDSYVLAKENFGFSLDSTSNSELLSYMWIRDVTGPTNHQIYLNAEYPPDVAPFFLSSLDDVCDSDSDLDCDFDMDFDLDDYVDIDPDSLEDVDYDDVDVDSSNGL